MGGSAFQTVIYMDSFFLNLSYYGTRTILALLEKQKKDLDFLRFHKLN